MQYSVCQWLCWKTGYARSLGYALQTEPSAQNLGTWSLWLRLASSSWVPMINHKIFSKLLPIASQVNSHASEIDSLTHSWGVSLASDFWNTQMGQLTLRGLFHQKMYIVKLMAAYLSITISRWVTGRCLMAYAMHCITNHNVWSRTRDLMSQSLFPLSLISTSVGMTNDLYSSLDCWSLLSCSRWRGLSSSCYILPLLLHVFLEIHSKRWSPPMMIKRPCIMDHCTK